ncbi:hypothetical protein CR194_04495 [Salipaludibacillus keqinensis]|uniref:Uncharacterized protein n=1 Tax=Salipaludibacillus keqinensis TaxID=2045207 RepID=A0A323TQL8_9BACI|nr:hypothetical protein CR194_04495 [Salipaludibacillus keqinensis]
MKDSRNSYASFIAIMSVSTPIGIIFGLDSWIHLFREQSGFQLAMFLLPVSISISVFCCIKAVKIKKSMEIHQ